MKFLRECRGEGKVELEVENAVILRDRGSWRSVVARAELLWKEKVNLAFRLRGNSAVSF